jgi:prepilin-type N-terminal cleavage/methylation domain-containing protein
MRLWRRLKRWGEGEKGLTLIETLVAVSILGTISVSFLNGLTAATKSVYLADEHSTAVSLAQSQMEWVKNAGYIYDATTYAAAPLPDGKDYLNYTVVITAQRLHNSDDGIQKITVTVKHSDEGVVILEGYKVDR